MKAGRGLYARRFRISIKFVASKNISLLTYLLTDLSKIQIRILSNIERTIFFSFRELILQQIKIGRAKLAANCWIRIDRYSRLKRVEPLDASEADIASKRAFRVHRTRYNASYFSNIEEGSFLSSWWKYFPLPKSMPKSFVCTYAFLYTRSRRRAALLGNYSIRWKGRRKGGERLENTFTENTRARICPFNGQILPIGIILPTVEMLFNRGY